MSDDITISNPDSADDASRLIGEEAADVSSAGTDETLDVADLLDAVAKERDEFKDLALRLQADFENFRKRVATQLGDDVDRATGKIVESILPVLDACEAAAAHGVQGIESVWSALLGSLQKQGLEALDLADKPFDPSTAEAVVHEPGSEDGTGPVVSEVLRTGYRWKGRVVRAAMVKVKG
jgi:molecular chaperone GrpE